MKEFHHVGLRRSNRNRMKNIVEPSKCWVTDPADSSRPQSRCSATPRTARLPLTFKNAPHAAYAVDELEPSLVGKDVIDSPIRCR